MYVSTHTHFTYMFHAFIHRGLSYTWARSSVLYTPQLLGPPEVTPSQRERSTQEITEEMVWGFVSPPSVHWIPATFPSAGGLSATCPSWYS